MKPNDKNQSEIPASQRDTQDGTIGFSPQLGGHGKAEHANTSSFDSGPPKHTLPGRPSSPVHSPNTKTFGQEEGGRKRQPTTSAVARINDQGEEHER